MYRMVRQELNTGGKNIGELNDSSCIVMLTLVRKLSHFDPNRVTNTHFSFTNVLLELMLLHTST